jgi:hypothetical protein
MELGGGLNTITAGYFSVLKGLFKKTGGGIELHGCGVASNTDVAGSGSTSAPQCVPGTFSE